MSNLLNQLLFSTQVPKADPAKTQDGSKKIEGISGPVPLAKPAPATEKPAKAKRKQDPNTKHKYVKRKVFLAEQAQRKDDPLAIPAHERADIVGVVPDDFPLHNNKRVGRRNSIPGNRRDCVLNFNVSSQERAIIDAEVARRGITLSMFLRCAVFEGMNLPRPHPEMMMHYSEYIDKIGEKAPEVRKDIAAPRPGKYGRFYDPKKPKGQRQIRHSEGLEEEE